MEANGETAPDMALSSACKGEAGPVGDSGVKLEPQPNGPTRVASIAGMTPENFREVALTVLTGEMKAWQSPLSTCAQRSKPQKPERNSGRT